MPLQKNINKKTKKEQSFLVVRTLTLSAHRQVTVCPSLWLINIHSNIEGEKWHKEKFLKRTQL